jgi:multicomponent Na+:H+ antiporter subunit D
MAPSLPPIAIVIPALVACLLLAVGRWLPRLVTGGLAISATTGVIGVEIALLARTGSGRTVTYLGGWKPTGHAQVGITLVADPVAIGAALTAASLVLAAQVYGIRYFRDAAEYYPPLVLLFLSGMTGFAESGDLFDMFVFFELMGAAAYALTGIRIEEPRSLHGALSFGVINSLGAYFSLMGIGLMYARTGQLGLAPIGAYLDAHGGDPFVTASFALVVLGLLVKAGIVPFHFWLADAHAVAPTPICIVFSGIMDALGLYGIARVYWSAFAGGIPVTDVRRLLLVLGVLTAIIGAIMCVTQRHLKRLLAYSTISHAGLFTIALATLNETGTTGATLYVLAHAAVKSALFLLAGVLLNQFGSVDEIDLFGRGKGAHLIGACFVIGSLALAGLPPFGTALGKAVSEEAAGKLSHWLTALFVVASAVTGGAVLRASLRIFFGLGKRPSEGEEPDITSGDEEPEMPTTLNRPALSMTAPIIGLLAAGLLSGVWSGIGAGVTDAAQRLIDHNGYLDAVLRGAHAVALHGPPEAEWKASGVLLGLLSTGLAAAIAFGAAYLPAVIPAKMSDAVGRGMRAALRPLHQLHSGHLGDYVAWLVVGIAGIAGLLGLSP